MLKTIEENIKATENLNSQIKQFNQNSTEIENLLKRDKFGV